MMADLVDMDTSTPGEGVLFHNTHCAELLQADPQSPVSFTFNG